MDCSRPGFPVQYQLPELAQTHAHIVGDAVQSSHLLSLPSPPAFSLSQHQGLFQGQLFSSGSQSIVDSPSASILPKNIQDCFPLELTSLISLQSKRLSRVFCNITVLRYSAFVMVRTRWTFVGKVMSLFFNMLCRLVIAFLPRSSVVRYVL